MPTNALLIIVYIIKCDDEQRCTRKYIKNANNSLCLLIGEIFYSRIVIGQRLNFDDRSLSTGLLKCKKVMISLRHIWE